MGMYGEHREFVLPSGRVLRIEAAKMDVSFALLEALAAEMRTVGFPDVGDTLCVAKDAFCAAVVSPKVKELIWECFRHCTIDKVAIDKENTFQKVEHRRDFIPACWEVAADNVVPFASDLLPRFSGLVAQMLERLLSALQKILSSSKSDSLVSVTGEELLKELRK